MKNEIVEIKVETMMALLDKIGAKDWSAVVTVGAEVLEQCEDQRPDLWKTHRHGG